jgi:hypothetical protein
VGADEPLDQAGADQQVDFAGHVTGGPAGIDQHELDRGVGVFVDLFGSENGAIEDRRAGDAHDAGDGNEQADRNAARPRPAQQQITGEC